jgi:mono/diheme cytochrome c family protein
MKFRHLLLALLLVVFIGSVWAALSRGYSTRNRPNIVEETVARRLRHLATPRSVRDTVNPVAETPEVLQEAMAHFADHCAFCHANDGGGNTDIGKGLYPKPPDMRLSSTQELSDGELYYIIRNGVRFTGMPAFGKEDLGEQDEDSWKLVHFIRHLPKISPEEVEQMKTLNPKSPQELAEEEQIRRFLQGEDVPSSQDAHKHHH